MHSAKGAVDDKNQKGGSGQHRRTGQHTFAANLSHIQRKLDQVGYRVSRLFKLSRSGACQAQEGWHVVDVQEQTLVPSGATATTDSGAPTPYKYHTIRLTIPP